MPTAAVFGIVDFSCPLEVDAWEERKRVGAKTVKVVPAITANPAPKIPTRSV
jgi:hypothetical protein